MIRLGPARPGDKTLADLFAERPELLDIPTIAVHVREIVRSS